PRTVGSPDKSPGRSAGAFSRSRQRTPKSGRRYSSRPAEARRKRTGLGVPDGKRNLGDRSVGKKNFGVLHAPVHVIAVGRHAQSLLECACEVVGTELDKTRQGRQADRFRKMFFDVFGDALALPPGETAASGCVSHLVVLPIEIYRPVNGQYAKRRMLRYGSRL